MSEAGKAYSGEWWGLWQTREHRAYLPGTVAFLPLRIAALHERGLVLLDILFLKEEKKNLYFLVKFPDVYTVATYSQFKIKQKKMCVSHKTPICGPRG